MSPAVERQSQRRPKVLVVDDDPMVLRVIELILERGGYEVVATDNATEALQHCRKVGNDFAFVLSDVTMPHIGGIELAERLSAEAPSLPVVLMSGNVNEIKSQNFRLICKPFTYAQLMTQVSQILETALQAPRCAPDQDI